MKKPLRNRQEHAVSDLVQQPLEHFQPGMPVRPVLHLQAGRTEWATELTHIGRVESEFQGPRADPLRPGDPLEVAADLVSICCRASQQRIHEGDFAVAGPQATCEIGWMHHETSRLWRDGLNEPKADVRLEEEVRLEKRFVDEIVEEARELAAPILRHENQVVGLERFGGVA